MSNRNQSIEYLEIDQSWRPRIAEEWNEMVERHTHFSDGFTFCAMHQQRSVGIISVYWRELPPPLSDTIEGYIDIIEVQPEFRKRGIARQLISLSAQRAQENGACQLGAWSSQDKLEAIPMWRELGFGLCPATIFPRGQEVHGFFVAKVLYPSHVFSHRRSQP